MNKHDYNDRMQQLITENPYKEINKTPLPKMIKESNVVRQNIAKTFGSRLKFSLLVSNPIVAKLYGLPKLHKNPVKMRQIVSSINTPSYKIAKWLVSEFRKLPPFKGFSIKNSFVFVSQIKELTLSENEVMISFDVSALFPSIPVEEALYELNEFLKQLNLSDVKRDIYFSAAKLCMEQNYFQFRNKLYKVEEGTNMGNPLSPLIADCCMSSLENKLLRQNLLPRFWCRYVDDVFAIVDKDKVNDTLNILNCQHESINFTHEVESDGKLAFLDLIVKRNTENSLEFEIFHKPTSTKIVITSDSFCPIQYKQAPFHSMIHRLVYIPLTLPCYIKERNYILNVAKMNGYKPSLIERIIKIHSDKRDKFNLSTLFTQNYTPSDMKRVSFNYAPRITHTLSGIFKPYDMQCVYKSTNKLIDLIGTTKNKDDKLKSSGIYSIQCNSCDGVYYGQKKRSIEKRFYEHLSYIKNKQCNRSALASHAINTGHTHFDINNISVVRVVREQNRLDAYQSYYIQSNENSLNLDNGNIESALFSRV